MAEHFPLLEDDVTAAVTLPITTVEHDPAPLHRVLDQHGFAVVTGVVPEAALETADTLWAADLRGVLHEGKSPNTTLAMQAAEDPPRTWPVLDVPLGAPFVSDFGLPQGRLAWFVRRLPSVRAVFSALHGVGPSDLVVGTDCVFFNPREAKERGPTATTHLWPHADLNKKLRSGQQSIYQSIVYVWPCGEENSSTVVWPGSHEGPYDKLPFNVAAAHYVPMLREGREDFVANARRVPVPAGGMLVWNSRTIHQGWPHGPRLAVPVCFEPKSRRSNDALEQKRRCVRNGVPTTHWASLGEPHGSALGASSRWFPAGVVVRHSAHLHTLQSDGEILPEIDAML